MMQYESLLVKSAHLLRALEVYVAGTLSSTSLVLRAWA